jgi:pimeloyl-ACP methyl ester carboxylesterase
MLWVLGIIVILWIILAQGTMTMRDSDQQAKSEFATAGVSLTTGTIPVSGGNIHYAFTGSDSLPTLYFIHGSPGSWDAFASFMKDKDLLMKFRMVSVDRPGFGYSDFGQPEHLPEQSNRISPLFRRLANDRPAFLAGHSLGGPLVVQLAADNPGVFTAIVLISASLDPAEEKPEKWRPVLFRTPLNYLVPGAMRPSNQELWYLKTDLQRLRPEFAKINCTVYFIHGAADTWVPKENVAYGRRMLVNARQIEVTMLPGANHFIPWNRFQEVRQVLLNLY